MSKRQAWIMPEDDARSMLRQIEDRIRSSEIEVTHGDMLIRFRSIIEDDLAAGAVLMPSPHNSFERDST